MPMSTMKKKTTKNSFLLFSFVGSPLIKIFRGFPISESVLLVPPKYPILPIGIFTIRSERQLNCNTAKDNNGNASRPFLLLSHLISPQCNIGHWWKRQIGQKPNRIRKAHSGMMGWTVGAPLHSYYYFRELISVIKYGDVSRLGSI